MDAVLDWTLAYMSVLVWPAVVLAVAVMFRPRRH